MKYSTDIKFPTGITGQKLLDVMPSVVAGTTKPSTFDWIHFIRRRRCLAYVVGQSSPYAPGNLRVLVDGQSGLYPGRTYSLVTVEYYLWHKKVYGTDSEIEFWHAVNGFAERLAFALRNPHL